MFNSVLEYENFSYAFSMEEKGRKRKAEVDAGVEGVTQGSGIHRPLDEHIDERFEKDLQAERGVKILKTNAEKKQDKRLIVVLENANLELGQCSEKHKNWPKP